MKSLGRDSLQLTEMRDSQEMTGRMKVTTMDWKSRPSRVRPIRTNTSKTEVQQYSCHYPEVQRDSWITRQDTRQVFKSNVDRRETVKSVNLCVGVREQTHRSKVPTTPVISTRAEFDIVTPKQEDLGGLQGTACGSPVDAPASQHKKPKGTFLRIYTYSILYMAV